MKKLLLLADIMILSTAITKPMHHQQPPSELSLQEHCRARYVRMIHFLNQHQFITLREKNQREEHYTTERFDVVEESHVELMRQKRQALEHFYTTIRQR